MRLTKPAKRDANERAILDAIRGIYIYAWPVSGDGLPDLLTYHPRRRVWLPVEVKAPGGHLTPAQAETFRIAPFPVVETVADALALFGVVDE